MIGIEPRSSVGQKQPVPIYLAFLVYSQKIGRVPLNIPIYLPAVSLQVIDADLDPVLLVDHSAVVVWLLVHDELVRDHLQQKVKVKLSIP